MKTLTSIVFGFILSINLLALTLEESALVKIDTLNNLISIAEADGLDVQKEKLTVRTAEVFLDFADWDEANVATNTDLFNITYGFKDDPGQWAADLADWERTEINTMLDDAITYLKLLMGGTYKREPSVRLDWTSIVLEGDQLVQNGKPVFLLDYTWRLDIDLLNGFFGNKSGHGIYPSWVQNASGTVNSWQLSQIDAKASDSRLGLIFIGHENPPSWTADAYGDDFRLSDLTAQYPDDYTGQVSRYTDFDIDNPGAKELVGTLLDAAIPRMAGKRYTQLGYMLCNEPHFYTTKTNGNPDWASSPVTSYTKEKFKTWLSVNHSSIARLNSLWGSNFASFDDVTIDIPIDVALTGTPMWYDWQRFNNERVLDWYVWMKSRLRTNDPAAKAHLKIMPNLWSENKRGHGIDFEALTEMSDIIGNDCAAHYNLTWTWKHNEWEDDYAFGWREMSMSYDFLKSVSPEKSVINTESHYLSTVSSRALDQDPRYAKATAWLSHVQGLTYEQAWYWSRREDGSPKNLGDNGYAGSLNQQPRIVNEMGATYLDMNTYSEEIMAMQRQRKPIRLFYSETSALNKTEHMDEQFELYEELVFSGVPLGFATQSIIEKQSNDLWDVILVYKTEQVTQGELDALQSYLDNGGTVIVDGISLASNEYGEGLGSLSQSSGTLMTASSLADFKTKAFTVVEANGYMPDVSLSESHTGTHDGCLWKVVKNDAGNDVLFVVNVGNTDATVNITMPDAVGQVRCKDLLRGVVLETTQVLAPYDMLFLEVSEVSTDNIFLNPGFEDSDVSMWQTTGSASVANGNAYAGSMAGHIDGDGSIFQMITLEPNTEYTLSCYAKVDGLDDFVYLGIDGTTEGFIKNYKFTSSSYEKGEILFTTGSDTAYKVWVWNSGGGQYYVDDFLIQETIATNLPKEKIEEIVVGPNPFKRSLAIAFPLNKYHTLEIIDMQGRVLATYGIDGEESLMLTPDYTLMPRAMHLLHLIGNGCSDVKTVSRL